MALATILWVDDEIESLQSQKLFLENKGYEVQTLTNGFEAIDFVKEHAVDVVLLDETMPGITGLETLAKIKEVNSQIPVVLITKNETENLMDEAIGSQITDYLIKPVNPNQVWLSLKKIIDNRRLVAEKTTSAYQQQFRDLFMSLNNNPDHNEWMEIYKKLVYWELEMKKSDSPEMQEVLESQEEETFYSILPTATQYSRNAIFAGLLPIEIEKQFPVDWKNDDEEGGKNLFELDFFKAQLKRLRKEDLKYSYTKITNHQDAQKLVDNMHNLLNNDINIIVYNFVDMLSHARTEMEVLKELAADEVSYRSLTASWFEHSPLHQALKKVADKNINIILATDHGSVRVKTPYKVVGDKQTTTNLRYKHGRNLNYEPKQVLAFRDPKEAGLPVPTVNSSFIFAKEDGH